jgi:hypothetical protein
MDSPGRLTELERRCADLEALNAQLARDLAAGAHNGSRPRGPAPAALHVSTLDRRLDEALSELTATRGELAAVRAELAAAHAELAAAHAHAETGWGRHEELRGRRAVRWALRLARLLRRNA